MEPEVSSAAENGQMQTREGVPSSKPDFKGATAMETAGDSAVSNRESEKTLQCSGAHEIDSD